MTMNTTRAGNPAMDATGDESIRFILREADHRISNSLQLLVAVMRLQERETSSKEAREAIAQACRRVLCIARLHRNLCDKDDGASISLDEYLCQLGDDMWASFLHGKRVQLLVNADPVMVTSRIAGSVGLIVNELVTNAIKHGHDGDNSDGVIDIACGALDRGRFELHVTNDMPAPADRRPSGSALGIASTGLGTKIVTSLLAQHGGTFSVEHTDRHTIQKVTMPTS
jgi:two-component sensor histidine kinase